MASYLFNFIIEQISFFLVKYIDTLLPAANFVVRGIPQSADRSSDSEESLSSMAGDDTPIWFDGVDKKLIEVHSRPKESIVDVSGRGSLVTKVPLISYKAIVRRRKEKLAQRQLDRDNGGASSSKDQHENSHKNGSESIPSARDTIKPTRGLTDELALDCEMVECYGSKSVLARVSIVNLFGHPILDLYATPPSKVTDYRTRWSGIRKRDLENAPSFEEVQSKVAQLIKDRIVIGHAVHNDFAVLKLQHPPEQTRDTARFFGKHYFLGKNPSLKKLSESILGVRIQNGEHDSVQDAQATMKLYVSVREKWEEGMLRHIKVSHSSNPNQKKKKQKTKPKKKKIKAFFVETI